MTDREFHRPSPEVLLELAQKEEAQKVRGRLTIYFGAAPGVGKTYAMLADARLRRQEGLDVVVGYVATHGRPETEALLEGLEIMPPRVFKYKGMRLQEVDLDRIIKRKPQIVLVDELAHTNAPGSRHAKRYQDVQELLNAGLDVCTTMNVQHLESLNDVIFQIMGLRVRETVPDTVIQGADEIKLIDLPPEELLKRLSEGKVYIQGIVGIAVENFFRPGNLLALREMALRVVAGSVDTRMLQYMQAHAIAGPWPVQERVVVGVFASPYAEKLVRAAFRFATELRAEWIAFHVETEKNQSFTPQEKAWLNKALGLANKLGARVVWLKGRDEAQEMAEYAQKNNVTKIVIGKPRRFGVFPSIAQRLLTRTPNIDIYLLDARTEKTRTQLLPRKRLAPSHPGNYLVSLLAVAVVTLIAFALRDLLSQVNLLILFLLPITGSAFYLGRGPSILATISSVLAFDYFFVPPYFTLVIGDLQSFLSFVVYVSVAVLISNLASMLRHKVALLRQSEARSTVLYGLSLDLVTAPSVDQVLHILVRHTRQIFPGEMAIFLPVGRMLEVEAITPGFDVNPQVMGVAAWVLHNRQPAGRGTGTIPQARSSFFPMVTGDKIMGVLAIRFEGDQVLTPENLMVINTIAHLGAMALDRIGFQQ
jgi:two-component system, OmpR family, sensor histidine kinase KdpD